jgi:hypothetical protein
MKRNQRTGHWTEAASDFLGDMVLAMVGFGILVGAIVIAVLWAIVHFMF